MITQDMLREAGACYFNDNCPGTCSFCDKNKANLVWLGEGKTLRQIAENKDIDPSDRLWVFDNLAPYSDDKYRSPEWRDINRAINRAAREEAGETGLSRAWSTIVEEYLNVRLFQLGDKADQ